MYFAGLVRLTLLIACAAAPAASAQTAEERLAGVNVFLQRGFAALAIDYSSDPVEQAARINSASEVSAGAKRGLTPDLQQSAMYPAVAANLAALDERIDEARAANACAFAQRQVRDALNRRDVDTATVALAGYTTVLKNLQGIKRMKTTAQKFAKEKGALEKEFAAQTKTLAAEKAAAAAAKSVEPPPPKVPPRIAALRANRDARGKIEDALRDKPGPVAASLFAALSASIIALKDVEPGYASVEELRMQRLQLASFARQPPGASAPLEARALRSQGVTSPISFELWEGWCYAFVSSTDAPFETTFTTAAPIVRFRQSDGATSQLGGFCSAGSGKMKVELTAENPKSRVTVLGWAAEKVPLSLTWHARLDAVDPCAEAEFAAAWRALVPGAVQYVKPSDALSGKNAKDGVPPGPVLVTDARQPSDVSVQVLLLDGRSADIPKARLTDTPAPPPPLRLAAQHCPALGARTIQTPDPVACRSASDASSSRLLTDVLARLAHTTRDEERVPLEREIRAIEDDAARRRTQDCAPFESSPAEPWVTRIHANLSGAPPAAGPRARLLVLETTPPTEHP